MQQLTTYHLPPDTYRLTGWISSREVGVPDLLDTLRLTSTIRHLDTLHLTSTTYHLPSDWMQYLAPVGYIWL